MSTWSAPASPCLASRFPYGAEITAADLQVVAAAERILRELGFRISRVRHQGDLARIEVAVDDIARAVEVAVDNIARAVEGSVRRAIVSSLCELGYAYVTLDLEGFRSGSMNEALEARAGTEEGR